MPAIDGDVPEGGVVTLAGAIEGDAGADTDSVVADVGTDASDAFEGVADASFFPDAMLDVPLMDATMNDADADDSSVDAGADASAADAGVDAGADTGDDT